jgi:hypothetical protein
MQRRCPDQLVYIKRGGMACPLRISAPEDLMGRWLAVVVVLLANGLRLAEAQVQSRPTDPPLVTAVNESWYRLREPLQFAGELYYPAGAAVFFDGNTMVRTGHYNGVPLYADTTVEPFSIVLVPISRGLLQPYERLRRGNLAGTTGSRTPSFPVRPTPEVTTAPMAALAPTAPPQPPGAIGVYTPLSGRAVTSAMRAQPAVPPDASAGVGTTGLQRTTPRSDRPKVVTLRRPEGNQGIWVSFAGARWVSAGMAVPLQSADFLIIGEYAGFPVFARRSSKPEVIYLPTHGGHGAPYRLGD